MGRGEPEGLSHVEIVHAGSEAQWLKYGASVDVTESSHIWKLSIQWGGVVQGGMSNASKNPFVLGQSEALYGHSLVVMMEILNE